jgi:hypothetical protein
MQQRSNCRPTCAALHSDPTKEKEKRKPKKAKKRSKAQKNVKPDSQSQILLGPFPRN